MTGVVYIDKPCLSRFSSYRIAKMTQKEIKFFPREKDRKNQDIVENENKNNIDESEWKFISKQTKKWKSKTE